MIPNTPPKPMKALEHNQAHHVQSYLPSPPHSPARSLNRKKTRLFKPSITPMPIGTSHMTPMSITSQSIKIDLNKIYEQKKIGLGIVSINTTSIDLNQIIDPISLCDLNTLRKNSTKPAFIIASTETKNPQWTPDERHNQEPKHLKTQYYTGESIIKWIDSNYKPTAKSSELDSRDIFYNLPLSKLTFYALERDSEIAVKAGEIELYHNALQSISPEVKSLLIFETATNKMQIIRSAITLALVQKHGTDIIFPKRFFPNTSETSTSYVNPEAQRQGRYIMQDTIKPYDVATTQQYFDSALDFLTLLLPNQQDAESYNAHLAPILRQEEFIIRQKENTTPKSCSRILFP